MSKKDCILEIKKILPQFSDDMIADALETVRKNTFAGKQGNAQRFKQLKEMTPEMEEYFKKRRIEKSVKMLEINSRTESFYNKHGYAGMKEVYYGLGYGSTRQGANLKAGAESAMKARSNAELHNLQVIMGDDMKVLMDPVMTKPVLETMVHVVNTPKDVDVKLPDELKPYEFVAKKIRKFNKSIIANMKRAGLDIREMEDYLIRQTHDVAKIVSVSKKEWVDFVLDRLDKVKTFKDITDPKEHRNIVEKIYEDLSEQGFSRQGAATLGAARKLHFIPEKFHEYHSRFGSGTIAEVLAKTARNAGRAQAIHLTLGPDGKKVLDNLEVKMKDILVKKGDEEGLKQFNSDSWKRTQMKNELFGFGENLGQDAVLNISKNNMMHSLFEKIGLADGVAVKNVIKALRTGQAATGLGFSGISTLTDPILGFSNYVAKTGTNNYFGKALDYASKYVSGFKGDEQKKIANLLGMTMDFETFRYMDDTGLTGKFKKVTDYALKYTGLDRMTKAHRTQSSLLWSSYMADTLKAKSFDNLDVSLKGELNSYNINADRWEQLKPAIREIDGVTYFSPSDITDPKLQLNAQQFMLKQMEMGAIAPGGWTKSMMRLGLNPDTVQGQVALAITQFKSFGVEAHRAWSEILRANPNKSFDEVSSLMFWQDTDRLKLVGGILTGALLTGTLTEMLRDLANGKKIDLTNPEAMRNLVMRGFFRGPFPIQYTMMADVAGGVYYEKPWRDLMTDLTGPSASDINDLGKIMSGAFLDAGSILTLDFDLEESKSAKEILRFSKKNAPLINTPFVKPLFEAAFYNELMESVNPGYMHRTEKRESREDIERYIPMSFY